MREELEKVRDLAERKITAGQEPPWVWYQYMKLREAANAILAGLDDVTVSRQSGPRPAEHLQLVASNILQDNAPPRRPDEPVQLPT